MFDEVQFPVEISEGATVVTSYNTVVVVTASGAEQRIGTQANGKMMWDVSQGLKTPTQIADLIAFFRARKGRLRGFRFKDWTDYKATDANMLLLTSGATETYQLRKAYANGGQTEYRKITKPVSGSVTLKRNGVNMTTGWTLDTTTGIVTVTANLGGTWTWTGEHDCPARFDTDTMKVNMEAATYGNWENIPVVELYVP